MKKFFNEKGLTLIEVLASLVILMIVFTGLMHFFLMLILIQTEVKTKRQVLM